MIRIAVIATVLASAAPALAFHEIRSFGRTANAGGGAGWYYTGSPRFKGYDCALCHAGAPSRIGIEVGGALGSGSYEPGREYRVDVRLVGEHRGLESAFNPNTFTADITDGAGRSVGRLVAPPPSIVDIVDDGRVAIAEGFGNGETEWSFVWIAPSEPVPAHLYVAMLDGDGAGDPEVRFIDPLNDDVAAGRLDLCPVGLACAPPAAPDRESSPAGCAAAAGHTPAAAVLALLAAGSLLARRRRGANEHRALASAGPSAMTRAHDVVRASR